MSIQPPKQFNYNEPQKRIHNSKGLHHFQSSIALQQFQIALGKIVKLVESKDVPSGVLHKEDLYTDEQIIQYEHELVSPSGIPVFNQPDDGESKLMQIYKDEPVVKSIVDTLAELSKLIDLTPPFEGPRRYGNFACRDWHTKIEESIEQILKKHISPYYKLENPDGFITELKWYILNSFGSKERLDFGTGHEVNFLAFLTGLYKVDILNLDKIDGYSILVIFGTYYNVVRKLITTYTLEPAGSHGVWGLDDHFHIIYILGASEILSGDHDSVHTNLISPKLVTNKSVVYKYSTRNLYFNSIAFIYKVKKGAFFEHSPILYDISNVKSWEKILKGLLKMFQVEVVGKFPVVQHFYFGNVLFPWKNINGVDLPIFVADEDIADKKDHNIDEVNQEWQSKLPIHHQNVHPNMEFANTTVPWKKKSAISISLQDRMTTSSTRRTPSPIHSSLPPPDHTTKPSFRRG